MSRVQVPDEFDQFDWHWLRTPQMDLVIGSFHPNGIFQVLKNEFNPKYAWEAGWRYVAPVRQTDEVKNALKRII